MYPYYQLFDSLKNAKAGLEQTCDPPEPGPEPLEQRSPKTSIILSYATWNLHGPSIQRAFARVRRLATKASNTEYEWIRRLVSEIETEIGRIKDKLEECSLGSPPEGED
jgi:hypothetical protein